MSAKNCISTTTSTRVKVSDKRSKTAVFLNEGKHEFKLFQFDGCIQKNKVACDWIVEKTNIGRIAVELKGSDIDHAARQIEEAIEYMHQNSLNDLKIAGLIICSRYPSIDTKIQRIKQKLAKKFKIHITVKTYGRDICFESVLK